MRSWCSSTARTERGGEVIGGHGQPSSTSVPVQPLVSAS